VKAGKGNILPPVEVMVEPGRVAPGSKGGHMGRFLRGYAGICAVLLCCAAVNAAGAGRVFPRYRDLKIYTTSAPDAKNAATIRVRTQLLNQGDAPVRIGVRLQAAPALQYGGGSFTRTLAAGKSAVWAWSFNPPAGVTRVVLTGAVTINGAIERDLYLAVQGPDPAGFADTRVEKITERARVVATYAPRTQASIDAEMAQIAAHQPQPALTLAASGKTDYAVLVDALPAPPAGQKAIAYWRALPALSDPQKELVDALEDLQRCLKVQTGAELPIRATTAGPAIILRQADPGAAAGLQDAYRLRTAGGNVLIEAKDLEGLRNGVYGLLTDHLDCHWFQPRGLGEEIVVPKDRVARLPALNEMQGSPWFSSVGVSWWNSQRWDRQMRTIINRGRMVFGHSWNTYLSPTDYPFDKYADYYARDREGKIRKVGAGGDQTNFCSTNPAVIEIVAKKVNEFFAANPDAIVKSLDPNDYAPLCLCDRCLALDKQYGQTREDGTQVADRLLHFSNEIYKRLDPKYKDRYLGFLAYGYQMELPISAKPTGKSHAGIICDFPPRYDHSRPWNDPTSKWNVDFYRLVKGWGALSGQLGYYDYYGHWYYFGPWDITQKIREDLPAFREAGGTFVMYEAQPNFAMQGLNHYIAGRLTWDLNADVDLLREEFFRKYYGPAADPMRSFWQTEERFFALQRPGIQTESRLAAQPEFWAELDGDLRQAEAAVAQLPADQQRFTDRIRFNRDGFDYGRMHFDYGELNGVARRTNTPADHAAALQYLRDHQARLEALEQTHTADQDAYWPPMVRPLFFLNVAEEIKAHQGK